MLKNLTAKVVLSFSASLQGVYEKKNLKNLTANVVLSFSASLQGVNVDVANDIDFGPHSTLAKLPPTRSHAWHAAPRVSIRTFVLVKLVMTYVGVV